MKQGVIYKVTNKVNGKIYIGQTVNFKHRYSQHIHDALKRKKQNIFARALRKYGIEQFEWSIIWTGDIELLNEMEIYYIKNNKSYLYSKEYDGSNGYNLTIGGDSFERSDELKAKVSLKNRSYIEYKWTHPDYGDIECSQHTLYTTYGLDNRNLNSVIKGRQKSCSGWRLKDEY